MWHGAYEGALDEGQKAPDDAGGLGELSAAPALCSVETLITTNIKYNTQGLVFVAVTSSSSDRIHACGASSCQVGSWTARDSDSDFIR